VAVRTCALLLATFACFHDAAEPADATQPSAIAQSCTVRGEHASLDSVLVSPDGGSAFRVGIADQAVEATFRPSGTLQLTVRGVIGFATTADVIPVYVTDDVVVERSQLRFAHGATVLAERFTGGRLAGAAVLYSEHANTFPDGRWTPAESIATTDVPCDRTTLDYVENDDWSKQTETVGDGTWWQVRGDKNELALRAEPRDDAPAITYIDARCSGGQCFAMTRMASRGEWTQLAKENEHIVVTGWIRTAELDKLPDGVAWGAYSYLGWDDDLFVAAGELGVAPEHDARIVPGTRIFAEPDAGVWATVLEDAVFRVRYRTGDAWAQVVEIPGIRRARYDWAIRPPAWVPVSALRN
jgi:hypothetical protein